MSAKWQLRERTYGRIVGKDRKSLQNMESLHESIVQI
jgi:rRNA processing protein Krr1/Pno1